MPSPPITRQNARSQTLKAKAEPSELTKHMIAPMNMTRSRPQRSERLPASTAPAAQPSSEMATTKPVITSFSPKSRWIESTTPLITEESKPNRKPPTAAAIDRPTARLPYGRRNEKADSGRSALLLMEVTVSAPTVGQITPRG